MRVGKQIKKLRKEASASASVRYVVLSIQVLDVAPHSQHAVNTSTTVTSA
jgi:hypothetical protein